jgi:hypothetical protein
MDKLKDHQSYWFSKIKKARFLLLEWSFKFQPSEKKSEWLQVLAQFYILNSSGWRFGLEEIFSFEHKSSHITHTLMILMQTYPIIPDLKQCSIL